MKSGDVTGLILAGGRGQRLGGLDKGLQRFRGRPLVEYMIDCLLPVCQSLVISANRSLDQYGLYGHPLVRDADPDFGGPLAGLRSALPQIASEYVIVVPCDMPELPAALLKRLLDEVVAEKLPLVYAADTLREHYSVFACRREPALLALEAVWQSGGRSLKVWQQHLGGRSLVCGDAFLFRNCNTPDTLLG